MLNYGKLPVFSTSGSPWWISVLQGSDWITHRKFILDESTVLFCLFLISLDGILSPGQLIIPALMLATDLSFLLGSFKLNQSDEPSPSKKKINLSSIKRKTPTVMGWIFMVSTRLWLLKFKSSCTLRTIKSY